MAEGPSAVSVVPTVAAHPSAFHLQPYPDGFLYTVPTTTEPTAIGAMLGSGAIDALTRVLFPPLIHAGDIPARILVIGVSQLAARNATSNPYAIVRAMYDASVEILFLEAKRPWQKSPPNSRFILWNKLYDHCDRTRPVQLAVGFFDPVANPALEDFVFHNNAARVIANYGFYRAVALTAEAAALVRPSYCTQKEDHAFSIAAGGTYYLTAGFVSPSSKRPYDSPPTLEDIYRATGATLMQGTGYANIGEPVTVGQLAAMVRHFAPTDLQRLAQLPIDDDQCRYAIRAFDAAVQLDMPGYLEALIDAAMQAERFTSQTHNIGPIDLLGKLAQEQHEYSSRLFGTHLLAEPRIIQIIEALKRAALQGNRTAGGWLATIAREGSRAAYHDMEPERRLRERDAARSALLAIYQHLHTLTEYRRDAILMALDIWDAGQRHEFGADLIFAAWQALRTLPMPDVERRFVIDVEQRDDHAKQLMLQATQGDAEAFAFLVRFMDRDYLHYRTDALLDIALAHPELFAANDMAVDLLFDRRAHTMLPMSSLSTITVGYKDDDGEFVPTKTLDRETDGDRRLLMDWRHTRMACVSLARAGIARALELYRHIRAIDPFTNDIYDPFFGLISDDEASVLTALGI